MTPNQQLQEAHGLLNEPIHYQFAPALGVHEIEEYRPPWTLAAFTTVQEAKQEWEVEQHQQQDTPTAATGTETNQIESDDTPVGTTPEPEPEPTPEPARNVWDQLADCESGNWIDGGASFETGSARWYWARPGTEVPPWGTTIHHGGLQFHPGTWDAYRLEGYPQYAYDATREQQIAVAERVLAEQGWAAWPTCSRKLGLR